MTNKYKEPKKDNEFRAKYASNTNPQEEWIKNENLFGNSPSKSKEMVNVGEKSPVQLMQDMLRGVGQGELINPYYSKDSQQKLAYLLTNQYKRNTYINTLESQLPKLQPSVAKNYRLLMLLLEQVSKNDVEVSNSSKGITIGFNQKVLDNQEILLERLRREKKAREEEERRIIKEYEDIIFSLHKITDQLASPQKEKKQGQK